MSGIFKFVAVLMAVALLAMPAAALANCRTNAAADPHECCPMSMQPTTSAMQTVPSDKPCCEMSSGRPESAAQLQSPHSSTTIVDPQQATTLLPMPVAPARSNRQDVVPINLLSCSQAALCTFLI